MKNYYKGILCPVKAIYEKEYLFFANPILMRARFKDKDLDDAIFGHLNKNDADLCREQLYFCMTCNEIKDYFHNELDNGNIIFNFNDNYKNIEIIYELVEYKKYLFGKELYTGLLFPLIQSNFRFYFDNRVEWKSPIIKDGSIKLVLANNCSLLNDVNNIIINSKDATIDDVNEYMGKFNKGFFSSYKKKKYVDFLENAYKKNIFYEEIKEVKPIIKEKQDTITTEMENIEFLIEQVTDLNEKENFKKKYTEILESSFPTIKPLSLETLVTLEAEIEFYLNFSKKNTDSIDNYLDELKKEYLINLIENNDKKTDLTIEKLNKITELFLKTKNNYSIIDQRKILKTISLIYLFEVIENKDNIDIRILENGYFKDNIKSIILGIKSLQEIGILESNINLYLDKDISIINVVNIIKELKVKKIDLEESKKLIKKI